MATQLQPTDYQPIPFPRPARPNIRVAFSTTTATRAVASALDDLPAATREATLDELAQSSPSFTRWTRAAAKLARAEQAAEACPAEPENEFTASCSALADAQIALLSTPAPTRAELATKVRLYFDVDAGEFEQPAIGASIKGDVERLLTAAPAQTGDWATALDEWNSVRAALSVPGLSDKQVDDLSDKEMDAFNRLLALPSVSVADIATKLRAWVTVMPTRPESFGPESKVLDVLADLERLAGVTETDAAEEAQSSAAIIIGADAEALIATARHVLSPHMFGVFLRWGMTATHLVQTFEEDADGDARCKRNGDVLDEVFAAIPITFEDFAFKTWIAGIEAGDCSCTGPLVPIDSFGTGIRDGVASIAADLSRTSTIARELDRFASKGWSLAGQTMSWPAPLADAAIAAFEVAQQMPVDLPAADMFTRGETERTSSPFWRGPLLAWDKAFAAYQDAVRASAAATDDSDPDNELGAVESYAFQRLLLLPAPSPAVLAIKARVYEETASWRLNIANDIARVFASDARRFAKVGALVETDAALLAAFAGRRREFESNYAADDMSPEVENAYFARIDAFEAVLRDGRATTIEGVVAKLRVGFANLHTDGWSDFANGDPARVEFRDGLVMADMYERIVWSAIEDLARIGGIDLSRQGVSAPVPSAEVGQ